MKDNVLYAELTDLNVNLIFKNTLTEISRKRLMTCLGTSPARLPHTTTSQSLEAQLTFDQLLSVSGSPASFLLCKMMTLD